MEAAVAVSLPSVSVLVLLRSVWPRVITTASLCDIRQEVGVIKQKKENLSHPIAAQKPTHPCFHLLFLGG